MQKDIQQPEQKQLLDIVAANMRGEKYTLPIADYPKLLAESKAQAVFLQVFDTVLPANAPEDPGRSSDLVRRYGANWQVHNQHAQNARDSTKDEGNSREVQG